MWPLSGLKPPKLQLPDLLGQILLGSPKQKGSGTHQIPLQANPIFRTADEPNSPEPSSPDAVAEPLQRPVLSITGTSTGIVRDATALKQQQQPQQYPASPPAGPRSQAGLHQQAAVLLQSISEGPSATPSSSSLSVKRTLPTPLLLPIGSDDNDDEEQYNMGCCTPGTVQSDSEEPGPCPSPSKAALKTAVGQQSQQQQSQQLQPQQHAGSVQKHRLSCATPGKLAQSNGTAQLLDRLTEADERHAVKPRPAAAVDAAAAVTTCMPMAAEQPAALMSKHQQQGKNKNATHSKRCSQKPSQAAAVTPAASWQSDDDEFGLCDMDDCLGSLHAAVQLARTKSELRTNRMATAAAAAVAAARRSGSDEANSCRSSSSGISSGGSSSGGGSSRPVSAALPASWVTISSIQSFRMDGVPSSPAARHLSRLRTTTRLQSAAGTDTEAATEAAAAKAAAVLPVGEDAFISVSLTPVERLSSSSSSGGGPTSSKSNSSNGAVLLHADSYGQSVALAADAGSPVSNSRISIGSRASSSSNSGGGRASNSSSSSSGRSKSTGGNASGCGEPASCPAALPPKQPQQHLNLEEPDALHAPAAGKQVVHPASQHAHGESSGVSGDHAAAAAVAAVAATPAVTSSAALYDTVASFSRTQKQPQQQSTAPENQQAQQDAQQAVQQQQQLLIEKQQKALQLQMEQQQLQERRQQKQQLLHNSYGPSISSPRPVSGQQQNMQAWMHHRTGSMGAASGTGGVPVPASPSAARVGSPSLFHSNSTAASSSKGSPETWAAASAAGNAPGLQARPPAAAGSIANLLEQSEQAATGVGSSRNSRRVIASAAPLRSPRPPSLRPPEALAAGAAAPSPRARSAVAAHASLLRGSQ